MAGALTQTAVPSTLGQGIQNLIEEDLGPGVTSSLNDIDKTWQDVVITSTGVVRSGLSRGWEFKKVYSCSISGAFKWQTLQDAGLVKRGYSAGSTPDADSLWQSQVWNSSALGTFPTSDEATNVGYAIRTLSLARARGNMFLPIEILQANELTKEDADFVAQDIKGLAMNIALRKAMSFFRPTTGYMARVSSWDEDGTAGNAVVATLNTSDAVISHFVNGQVVDVYDDTGGSAPIDYADKQSDLATSGMVVDGVDYVAKTVRLVDPAGSNAVSTDGFAAGDYIVPQGQTATTLAGPYGLDSWIKGDDTDTLFGGSSGIDLTYYKQFKSITDTVGDILDEDELTAQVGAFTQAYPGVKLDTVLTTRGVTHGYLTLPSMTSKRFNFDRDGKPLKYEGGWDGVGFTYDGQHFSWKMSQFVWPGSLYVTKMRDGNVKMYVPPAIPGASRDGRVGDEIQFIAGVGGIQGIFMLVRNGDGAVLPMVEAPFQLMYQLAPEEVRAIKLTTITEV